MNDLVENPHWSVTRIPLQNEMYDVLKSPTNDLYQIRKWTNDGWSPVYLRTAVICDALNYYDKKGSHKAELKLYKNLVVWESDPSGDDPTFTQGSEQAHETAEPVTAEQCTVFVSEIHTLTNELNAAGDDIVALNQKIAGLAKALEESVPAKPSAEVADLEDIGVVPAFFQG